MIRTKIATALAAVGVAALTVTALPGAAHANPEWYSSPASSTVSPLGLRDCPSTNFCFWDDINYGGPLGKVTGNNRTWTAFRQTACPSGTWNDCASSAYNHGTTGLGVHVYEHTDYRGLSDCIPRGWYGNLTGRVWDGTWTVINDQISSNYWAPC
ncbi:peptidase inhibitor family I36 protein [Streptomyces sp. NPDC050211]|uniref:peptidase inhibitor family I36 protein n=1 Tax=Streptomyces sp. NPDC050211 TaxID=3154932 RepID=UPI00342C8D64